MDKCVQKTTVNCHNCHAFGVCPEIADACEAYLRGELTKEGECNAKVYTPLCNHRIKKQSQVIMTRLYFY